jgi:tripartite-type tricarboxylate transporter receptor subunit TctC
MGALLAVAGPAFADEAGLKDFYAGRQMELIIASAPGGNYDAYARLIARHMGKYIPGEPTMVAKNMPGAGGARATGYIYNVAPKDGSSFAAVFPGGLVEPLFSPAKADQYDPTKLFYLGSANNEVGICMMWNTSPVKTMEQALAQESVIGATAAGSPSRDFAAALINVLGVKTKVVTGYEGSKDLLLAMERGEIQGICGHLWSTVVAQNMDWVRDKKVSFWGQMSVKSHPDLADVPQVSTYAKTDEQKQILDLIFGQLLFGRPYIAPPGMVAGRGEALRAAFAATVKDAGFKAEAGRAKLELQPVSGEEVESMIKRMYRADPKLVAAAAQAQILKAK